MPRVAVCVTPAELAEMMAWVYAATGVVATAKVVVVAPAGIVTLAGIDAAGLLLARLTTTPPAGAGPLRATVASELLPPITAGGLSVTALGLTTLRLSLAVQVMPLKVADSVTCVKALTGAVLTVKVALLAPAGTVTVAGTVAN